MKKKEVEQPAVLFPQLSTTAVYVERVSHLSSQAYELVIEGGIVISKKRLGESPDLPASTIGRATSRLWLQVRGS